MEKGSYRIIISNPNRKIRLQKLISQRLIYIIILFVVTIFSSNIFAQTSIRGGEWDRSGSNSPWGNTGRSNNPGYNLNRTNTIIVSSGHEIFSEEDLGGTTVNSKTLTINGTLNLAPQSLTMGTGSALNVNGTMTAANVSIGAGNVTVGSSGNLTINNNLSFTSTTTASTLTTNGTLDIGGNLSASNGFELNVNDSLKIAGSFSAGNDLELNIPTGGVMEVYGNFTATNDAELTIDGLLIVFGNFNLGSLAELTIGPTGVLIIAGKVDVTSFELKNITGRIVFLDDYLWSLTDDIVNSGIIYSKAPIDPETIIGEPAKALIEVLTEDPITDPNNPPDGLLEPTADILDRYGLLDLITLPIDLLSFTATATEQDVVLKWSTATETNNDFFTLEKTRDGKEFEMVAKIDGAGNSKDVLEYTFTDTRPFAGTSYYRLTQTDFDGTSETFPLISVVFNSDLFSKLNIASVYPNAFQEAFVLQYTSPENNPVELNMINLKGEVIYRQNFRSEKGFNELRFTEGSMLQNDVYMIYLVQGGQVTQTQRVLKR